MLYAVNKAQLELRKLDSISERRMGIVGCVRGLGRPNRARYAAMEGWHERNGQYGETLETFVLRR